MHPALTSSYAEAVRHRRFMLQYFACMRTENGHANAPASYLPPGVTPLEHAKGLAIHAIRQCRQVLPTRQSTRLS